MPRSTSVLFGYYLECVMKPDPSQIPIAYTCTNDAHHFIRAGDKFCPVCGHPVQVLYKAAEDFIRFNYVTDDPETYGVSQDDANWLIDNCIAYLSGNDDNDVEIIVTDRSVVYVDGDETGPTAIDIDRLEPPTLEEVNRLTSIMQYEKVTVKFGAVVNVFW